MIVTTTELFRQLKDSLLVTSIEIYILSLWLLAATGYIQLVIIHNSLLKFDKRGLSL